MAFAFTSSSTLPLYAALKGSHQPITTKTPKSRSFRILSILSIATATLLLLPLVFFSASPNGAVSLSLPPHKIHKHISQLRLKQTSTHTPNSLITVLSASTLLLRIPFLLLTTPKISIPTFVRRSTTTIFQDRLGKVLIWATIFILALVSTFGGVGETVGKVVNDLGLVCALLGTYLLPGKWISIDPYSPISIEFWSKQPSST